MTTFQILPWSEAIKLKPIPQVVYLKEELLKQSIVKNEKLDIFLAAFNNTVVGFKSILNGKPLDIKLSPMA